VQAVGYTETPTTLAGKRYAVAVADSSAGNPHYLVQVLNDGFGSSTMLVSSPFSALSVTTRSMGSRPWRRCRWQAGPRPTHRRSYLLHRTGVTVSSVSVTVDASRTGQYELDFSALAQQGQLLPAGAVIVPSEPNACVA